MKNKAVGIVGIIFFVLFGIPAIGMAIMHNELSRDWFSLGFVLGFVGFVGATLFGCSFIQDGE